jgi:hypothetical protein
MDTKDEKFGQLATAAYLEFGDIGDFIWKAPRFIDAERKLEIGKLDAYFPIVGDADKDTFANKLRTMRWADESHKLENVFPFMIASGNLFASVSVFETYCHRLCKEIERHSGLSLSATKGNGISRYFKFLTAVPIKLSDLSFREQVHAALLIRNCLFHASGLLEWSRNSEELRQIISHRRYWAEYTRKRVPEDDSTHVAVREDADGPRIQITNNYVHTAAHYLKFHFIDLCKEAEKVCTGECTIGLPTTSQYFDSPPSDET